MDDFTKYQALGNDYLILDPGFAGAVLGPEPDQAAVRLLCDRRYGAGADGLLLGPLEPPQADCPVPLRIFNSDGSECEMSGNGLRMFALYLAEHYGGAWRAGKEFAVRLRGGDALVQVMDFSRALVRVNIGRPRFAPNAGHSSDGGNARVALVLEGLDAAVSVTDLHLGVPHTVMLMDRVDEDVARRIGPSVAWHPRYPEGTNVGFVRVKDHETLEVEVWERAAGYVTASGAGACAATAVAYARGLVKSEVRVCMPGGDVSVSVAPDGQVASTGAAREVVRGCVSAFLREELMRRTAAPEPSRRSSG